MSRQFYQIFLPLLFLFLLTIALTWPTAITLTTHVVDRQDPLLNAWIMAWEARQLLLAPQDLYHTTIFFPLHNTLAFSELLLSTSLLVMPLQWFTGNALLSYNIAFLLSFFTTALGAYLLALYLTGQRGAALVAALAFAWSPYRMGHLSQVQLLAFGWLPLALIYLDRLLRDKQRLKGFAEKATEKTDDNTPLNPLSRGESWKTPLLRGDLGVCCRYLFRLPLKNTFLFTLFFLLQALASFYSALFSAMACALYVLGWLLWKRHLPWRAIAGGTIAALVVALVMLPLSLPYFEIQQTLGAGWTLQQNEQFSASLQAYLYAPEGSKIWGAITSPLYYVYGPCCPPDSLLQGLTVLFLSGVTLWRGGFARGRGGDGKRGRGGEEGKEGAPHSPTRPLAYSRLWLMIGLVGFLLSLGPTLTIRAGEVTGIPLPYRWLWDYVPGFTAIRAPVRWAVLLSLALSMLAAIGITRLQKRWLAPLAFMLILLEFAIVPLPLVTVPEAPDSLAWLNEQAPTRILELPLAAERPRSSVPNDQPRRAWEISRLLEMQYFSTQHWHTTPDGYSGYIPNRHGAFTREIQAFPSRRSMTLLRGLGVRYVIIHQNDLNESRLSTLNEPLPEGVRDIALFGDERILELAPYQSAGLPKIALPISNLSAEQQIEYPLVLSNPNDAYVPLIAEPLEVDIVWQQEGEPPIKSSAQLTWPMIIEEVAILPLSLQTPTAGEWTLTLSGNYPSGEPFSVTQQTLLQTESTLPQLLPVQLAQIQQQNNSLTLTWRTQQALARYYSISVRLIDQEGNVIAQQDGPPGGESPTIAWQAGNNYDANWTFEQLGEESNYQLIVLWYDPEGGAPVRIWHEEGFVEWLEVELDSITEQ